MTDTFSLPRLEPGFSAIIAQLTAQGEMQTPSGYGIHSGDNSSLSPNAAPSATLPHTGYVRQS